MRPSTQMAHSMNANDTRISEIAKSLDCLTEEDFAALAGVKATTADDWRRRGKGPAYVRLGTRYLYPRTAVAEFIRANVHEQRTVPAKEAL